MSIPQKTKQMQSTRKQRREQERRERKEQKRQHLKEEENKSTMTFFVKGNGNATELEGKILRLFIESLMKAHGGMDNMVWNLEGTIVETKVSKEEMIQRLNEYEKENERRKRSVNYQKNRQMLILIYTLINQPQVGLKLVEQMVPYNAEDFNKFKNMVEKGEPTIMEKGEDGKIHYRPKI